MARFLPIERVHCCASTQQASIVIHESVERVAANKDTADCNGFKTLDKESKSARRRSRFSLVGAVKYYDKHVSVMFCLWCSKTVGGRDVTAN